MAIAIRMKRIDSYWWGAIGIVLALICVSAKADIYVIAHHDTRITVDQIKEIYTGERRFAGQILLKPVDNGLWQSAFLASALNLDISGYNTIWIRRSFREGQNPPPVKSGDDAVINFVRNEPGAVGYVTSQPRGVNIVHKY